MRIFVYGTLMSGLERATVLNNSQFLGAGTIQATLYNLGSYPCITEGSTKVVGEIYEVDDTTLQELDVIDGYDKHEPEASLYYRKQVTAIMIDGQTQQTAEAYYYNLTVENGELIESGDYRKYLEV